LFIALLGISQQVELKPTKKTLETNPCLKCFKNYQKMRKFPCHFPRVFFDVFGRASAWRVQENQTPETYFSKKITKNHTKKHPPNYNYVGSFLFFKRPWKRGTYLPHLVAICEI
jgi:hypothetical protein